MARWRYLAEIALSLVVAGVFMAGLEAALPSGHPVFAQQRKPALRDQLQYGLHATQAKEVAFIDRVVAKVDDGVLPMGMVQSAYDWALRKRPDYGFPYFERGLKALAKKKNIVIE